MGTNNPLVTKSSGIKPRPQGGGGGEEGRKAKAHGHCSITSPICHPTNEGQV